MKVVSNIIKLITDFLVNPAKRKVLHINRPTFDLEQKGSLFTQFANLEELTLNFDAHYSYGLPEEIGQISSLKKLFILNYPFTQFPLWVFDLKNLEDLTIRGNTITFIPKGIGQLSKLRRLRFEQTDLESLPVDIQDLRHLRSLSLVDNLKLKHLNPDHLPVGLLELALTSSSISQADRSTIKLGRPKLRLK